MGENLDIAWEEDIHGNIMRKKQTSGSSTLKQLQKEILKDAQEPKKRKQEKMNQKREALNESQKANQVKKKVKLKTKTILDSTEKNAKKENIGDKIKRLKESLLFDATDKKTINLKEFCPASLF